MGHSGLTGDMVQCFFLLSNIFSIAFLSEYVLSFHCSFSFPAVSSLTTINLA